MKRQNGTGKSWKGRSEVGVDSEGTLTIKSWEVGFLVQPMRL